MNTQELRLVAMTDGLAQIVALKEYVKELEKALNDSMQIIQAAQAVLSAKPGSVIVSSRQIF